MRDEIIDEIYESSFIPECWPKVLDSVARIVDAPGGAMAVCHKRVQISHWVASERALERTQLFLNEKWLSKGNFADRIRSRTAEHPGFLVDRDLFAVEEIAAEPVYRDFWGDRGGGWLAVTEFPAPKDDKIFFAFVRKGRRGPVEPEIVAQLDALRPHLARSAIMAVQLQLARAQAVGEALALTGLPAVVLDRNGKALAANRLIEAMTDTVRWRARDQIMLTDRAANTVLQDAIDQLGQDDATSVARTFPLRAEGDVGIPMVAHLLPIKRSARDIFVHCAAALIVTPVGATRAPSSELVQSLFDLTPAEARIARCLVNGRSVEQIAADQAISRNTVRSHLRGVMEKTGCNRQAEVVALLGGLAPITRLALQAS